jgi:hypothetical protein
MGLMAVVDTEVSMTLCDMTFSAERREINHSCSFRHGALHRYARVMARVIVTKHVIVDVTMPLSAIISIDATRSAFQHHDDYVPKRKNL